MPFCPKCGLNVAELEEGAAAGAEPDGTPAGAPGGILAGTSDEAADAVPDDPDALSSSPSRMSSPPFGSRDWPIPPVVVAAVFLMIGLIAFGLLTRPQPGAVPAPGGPSAPGASVVALPPPIVGLTILSPSDGQAVAAPEVTVIGTAPPGVSITQDISLGLDQHTTTDGTGHWAIKAGLNEGDNKLTFRIGDDRSTEKSIRVTYAPARTP
jgi:hypothetical protein